MVITDPEFSKKRYRALYKPRLELSCAIHIHHPGEYCIPFSMSQADFVHQLCFSRGRGGELDVLVLFGGFGFVQKRDCPGDPPVG